MSPRRPWCVLGVGLALALAGCAGEAPEPAPGAEPASEAEPSARETPGVFGPDREPAPPTYTVSRGEYTAVLPDTFASSLPGLEVLSWVTADPGGRVAGVLEDLFEEAGTPPEADGAALSRWARSGLRVRIVPLAELPSLVGALPPERSLNRRAWGTVPQWQPAISASERVDRMRIHDGSIDRDPGSTPRLLLRGWVEPVIETGGGAVSARVRAELVPQFHTSARAAFAPVARLSRPADQGTVLGELRLSAALAPGTALVVTAEPVAAEDAPIGAGPPTPTTRSLGSVLFVDLPERVDAPGGARAGAARALAEPSRVTLLVLVPVVPADVGEGR